MEFSKLRKNFLHLKNNKFVVFSGVTGVGGTTLTESIGRLFAPNDNHRMELFCAPQFDLRLHDEYIGQRINGQFRKGKLLKFWDRCITQPDEPFLLFIDDFDKINPETFFGPEIWRKLYDRDYEVIRDGNEIIIPDNFYMIMSIHSGQGSRIELNDEHFKRLGGKVDILPNTKELIIYLQREKLKLGEALAQMRGDSEDGEEVENRLAVLKNKGYVKRHVYFFQKMNELIEKKFSKDLQLGQRGIIKDLYQPEDFDEAVSLFMNHVNALSSGKDLTRRDVKPILYTIRTNGKLRGSNTIATQMNYLEERGFLTEFFVGLSFLFLTAIFSWYLFRQKLKYTDRYTQRVYDITKAYKDGDKTYNDVRQEFHDIENEVDKLVLKRDISYTEAVFFYNFIEHRNRRIEQERSIDENFMVLVNSFLEDGQLEKKERDRLIQYLENIKYKMTTDEYGDYKRKIQELYKKYR